MRSPIIQPHTQCAKPGIGTQPQQAKPTEKRKLPSVGFSHVWPHMHCLLVVSIRMLKGTHLPFSGARLSQKIFIFSFFFSNRSPYIASVWSHHQKQKKFSFSLEPLQMAIFCPYKWKAFFRPSSLLERSAPCVLLFHSASLPKSLCGNQQKHPPTENTSEKQFSPPYCPFWMSLFM